MDEGRRDAEVVKRRIEEEARHEADRTVERAKREIQIATDTATKELYTLSARLATDMAARVIRKELTPQDHERLIAESIAELGAVREGDLAGGGKAMASVDDRDLALGRLYGVPLLDLGEEQGQADDLLGELQEVVRLLDGNPTIEDFFASPLVDADDRRQVIEKVFRGKASDLLVDALQVVNRKGRLGFLRAIAEAYRLAYRDRRGLVDARVRTAVPLDEVLRAGLRQAIARFTGKQPTLDEKVDPCVARRHGGRGRGHEDRRQRGLAPARPERGAGAARLPGDPSRSPGVQRRVTE